MYFLFEGGRIYYSDTGNGAPVVLLHGYLETSDVWYEFADKLSENFRVITVDLPGHGGSDSYGSSHTMEFMASVVKGLLESLSLEKVFLTGHSLGGYVTLAFVDFYPDSLSGCCLFHSQPFPDTPEIIEKRMREIALIREGNKELFYPENIKRMYATSNLQKFSGALQQSLEIASGLEGAGIIAVLNGMMMRPSRLHVMEKGLVPCLWILGALDNYIPCEIIRTRVKLPSNAMIVVLENSGHMGFIEEEELSVKILTDFIRDIK